MPKPLPPVGVVPIPHMAGVRYRWVVLAMVFLVHATAIALIWQSIPPLKATIAADLGVTTAAAVLVFAAINITLLVGQLPGGLLGDRFSVRTVVGLGAVFAGVATAGRFALPTLPGLLATSVLAGVGMSLVNPNLIKVVTEWFGTDELGVALGVTIAGLTIGSGVAASLSGGAALDAFGSWEAVFVAYGALTTALGLCWLVLVRSPRPDERPRYATPGMAALVGADETAREALSAVVRAPSTPWAVALAGLSFWAILGSLGVLPEYADALPFPVSEALLGVPLFAATPGALVLPPVSDRVGRQPVLVLSVVGLAAGVLVTGFAPTLPVFVLGMVGAGVFGGGLLGLLYLLPGELRDVGPARAGTMAGVLLSLGQLGGTVGPVVGAVALERLGLEASALLIVLPLAGALPCIARLRLVDAPVAGGLAPDGG